MTERASTLALALSSSTGVMSAAVGRIGSPDPLAVTTVATDRRHAEEISPLIQKLLADGGIILSDLGLLVVDRGPGRFTGLRVGLATVKSLAFALGVPVVGLTSLETLAAVARVSTARRSPSAAHLPVTAVIDARRHEVFQQRFGIDGEQGGEPRVGPAAGLAAEAVGLVVGDGADRYRDDYEAAAVEGVELVTGVEIDASVMLTIAIERSAVPAAGIEPLYLRDPDVNPNVKTRPRA